MQSRQRIICCFARHQEGGACRQLYSSVEALLAEGYKVVCVSAGELRIASHPNLELKRLSLPCRKERGFRFWLWFSVLMPLQLLSLAFADRRSVFLCVRTYYAALARPAAFFLRIPIVLLLDTLPWPPAAESTHHGLKRFVGLGVDFLGLLAADKIITATDALQQDLAGRIALVRGRMHTLRPALIPPPDASSFSQWFSEFPQRREELVDELNISDRWILLATGGELTTRKNIECLVRAISATENERIGLIVVGDGPERLPLNSIAVGLGLVDQIIFTSWSRNTYELVGACDLFVMPSMFFGMSNLVVEALSSGIGVIAADVPDMHEILQHQELLFPVGDVDALCKKIQQIVHSKGQLELIRKLSREQAQLLSKNWGKELAAVIETL